MSPRKVRLVVDSIRDLTPDQALEHLSFIRKKAAVPVAKTIRQAVANAVNTKNLRSESLRFREIQVGEGPTYKRWRAVSRGRAHSILKRTSHIKVLLESIDGKQQDKTKSRSQSLKTKKRKIKETAKKPKVKTKKKQKKLKSNKKESLI